MKKELLFCAVLTMLFSRSLFADDLNAAGKVEFAMQVGGLRLEGGTLASTGFDVAVRATGKWAIIGDIRASGAKTSIEFEDNFTTYRAGLRYSERLGKRMTIFVQGAAGEATRHSLSYFTGFSRASGLSIAGGGGLDIGKRSWLAVRVAQAEFEMFRPDGQAVNGFRISGGLVIRMGQTR